jgi:hypothetical protein
MDCQGAEELVSRDLDGRLTDAELEELSSHLAACPGCARDAEKTRAAEELLRALGRQEPSSTFGEELRRRIDVARNAPPASRFTAFAGKFASLAAGLAMGVVLAGAFHMLAATDEPTKTPNEPPVVEETDNLVRLAGDRLGRNLKALEIFNNDVRHLASEEPDAAPEILSQEISALGIPERIGEIRRDRDMYRRKNPAAGRILEGILSETEAIVHSITKKMKGNGNDPEVLSDISIRADASLRRMDPLRESFGPDFLPPANIAIDMKNSCVTEAATSKNAVGTYTKALKYFTQGKGGPAIRLFHVINRDFPGSAVARRGKDWEIVIYAGASRSPRNPEALRQLARMLEKFRLSRTAEKQLVQALHGWVSTDQDSASILKGIRFQIFSNVKFRTRMERQAMQVALLLVGSVEKLEIDGRLVSLALGDRDRALRFLRSFSAPWEPKGNSFNPKSGTVTITLEKPKGGRVSYSAAMRAEAEKLNEKYPGAFVLDTMGRIRITGRLR